jgi:hypothetical protein
MRTLRWTALALAGVLASVIVAPVRAQNVEIKPTSKPKRDKYVITAEEIAEHPELRDGYDVVRLLRNQWLRPTRTSGNALTSFANPASPAAPAAGCRPNSSDPACSTTSGAPVPRESGTAYADADGSSAAALLPVVYIDEIKRDGVNDLKALRPGDIVEIRFLTGTQASGRYGSGHENGAILVKTMRFGQG